jgi:hypothetical protein
VGGSKIEIDFLTPKTWASAASVTSSATPHRSSGERASAYGIYFAIRETKVNSISPTGANENSPAPMTGCRNTGNALAIANKK